MARTIVHIGRKIQVALDAETLPDGRTIRRDVVSCTPGPSPSCR